MLKQSVMMTAVTSLAVLVSSYGGAVTAQECVGPSPRKAPVKVVNIFNNSTKPIFAVLEIGQAGPSRQ
jgi:hypothetical protein